MNDKSMKNKRRVLIITIVLLLVASIVFAFVNNSKIIDVLKEQGKVDNKEASKLVDLITVSDYGQLIIV